MLGCARALFDAWQQNFISVKYAIDTLAGSFLSCVMHTQHALTSSEIFVPHYRACSAVASIFISILPSKSTAQRLSQFKFIWWEGKRRWHLPMKLLFLGLQEMRRSWELQIVKPWRTNKKNMLKQIKKKLHSYTLYSIYKDEEYMATTWSE